MSILIDARRRMRARSRQGTALVVIPEEPHGQLGEPFGSGELDSQGSYGGGRHSAAPTRREVKTGIPQASASRTTMPNSSKCAGYRNTSSAANHWSGRALFPRCCSSAVRDERMPERPCRQPFRPHHQKASVGPWRGAARRRPRGTGLGRVSRNPRKSRSRSGASQAQAATPAARQRESRSAWPRPKRSDRNPG